jgi:hypothetical protein
MHTGRPLHPSAQHRRSPFPWLPDLVVSPRSDPGVSLPVAGWGAAARVVLAPIVVCFPPDRNFRLTQDDYLGA